MAKIAPFHALRYPQHDGTDLMAPPYDVLDDEDTARYRAKDPHNITHLIMTEKGDPATYDRKAKLVEEWIASGALVEEKEACLYLLRQTFNELGDPKGPPLTRWCLTCCVGIHEYSDRVVLPHERTLSGPKEDRLNLMKATNCNFSQVMGLFQGSGGLMADFEEVGKAAPEVIYTDELGVKSELWVIRPGALMDKVIAFLADKPVLIADGHHRYETSLNFMKHKGAKPGDDASYMTWSIIDSADPGVVLYPIHRWIQKEALDAVPGWQDRLSAWFDMEQLEELPADAHSKLQGEERVSGPPTYILIPKGQKPIRLTIRPQALQNLSNIPEPLKQLETLVLQAAFFDAVLGLTAEDIAKEKGIGYLKDFSALGKLMARDEVGAVVLCRPTPVSLVWDLALQGITLPQKSTFFYPKLPSGMTMRKIR